MTLHDAITKAKRFAAEGPRVAAVLHLNGKFDEFEAIPGYVDADTEHIKQVRLVTPDGQEWARM